MTTPYLILAVLVWLSIVTLVGFMIAACICIHQILKINRQAWRLLLEMRSIDATLPPLTEDGKPKEYPTSVQINREWDDDETPRD